MQLNVPVGEEDVLVGRRARHECDVAAALEIQAPEKRLRGYTNWMEREGDQIQPKPEPEETRGSLFGVE